MRNIAITLTLFCIFCMVGGCKQPPTFSFQIDETILQEGDIVFRKGQGLASRVVLIAEKSGGYSHVGIIVKDSSGWSVIHAVPGETDKKNPTEVMKKETLAQFFAPHRAVSGAIFRLDTIENIPFQAAQKAKVLLERKLLFDHKYNLEDSTKMYCTELLYFVYNSAGVDISEGRRNSYPAMQDDFLLPGDILSYSRLREVWSSK